MSKTQEVKCSSTIVQLHMVKKIECTRLIFFSVSLHNFRYMLFHEVTDFPIGWKYILESSYILLFQRLLSKTAPTFSSSVKIRNNWCNSVMYRLKVKYEITSQTQRLHASSRHPRAQRRSYKDEFQRTFCAYRHFLKLAYVFS